MVWDGVYAFDGVHKFDCDFSAGVQSLPDHISKLLNILFSVFSNIRRQDADEELPVRTMLVYYRFVKAFYVME